MKEKNTFGLIIGNRGFFPDVLVKEGREQIINFFEKNGFNVICLSTEDTKFGGVETLEDAIKCGKLFDENRNRIDGIIVTLPNFGDERAVANSIKFSKLNVPVYIHAFNDNLENMTVARRRDSFCGKISVCNNLYQYGIKFSLPENHTENIDSNNFKNSIEWFAGVCRVTNKLRNARVGAIGARTGAFNTVRFSEKLLQQSGITTEVIDLADFLNLVNRLNDSDKQVIDKLDSLKSYVKINSNVSETSLIRMAKFGVALDNWVKEMKLDAIAIQCWTALQEIFGIVPCTLMSKLSESLLPSACEVDIPGALSMLALQEASNSPSAIVDWNNNFGYDENKCIIFHCSNIPKSFFINPEMKIQEIISQSVGNENSAGACVGKLAPGPITFCRITTDDFLGDIKAYVGEGEIIKDSINTFGGYGVVNISNLKSLLFYICEEGFEHHTAISKSQVSDIIYESFTKYLGWDTYYHI